LTFSFFSFSYNILDLLFFLFLSSLFVFHPSFFSSAFLSTMFGSE